MRNRHARRLRLARTLEDVAQRLRRGIKDDDGIPDVGYGYKPVPGGPAVVRLPSGTVVRAAFGYDREKPVFYTMSDPVLLPAR